MFLRRAFLSLLFQILLGSFPVAASWSPVGARSLSLSGCQVTSSDVMSCLNNPAGIGSLRGLNTGLFYESRFFNSGISTKAVGLSSTFGKAFSAGLGIREFGNSNLKDQAAALSVARPFGSKLLAGAAFEWNTLRFSENYGSSSALSATFGMVLNINHSASFGVAVRNPFRASYKSSEEPLLSVLNAGFKWAVSQRSAVFLESEMSPGLPYSWRSGLEYTSSSDFSVRLGVSNTYMPVSFGAGVKMKNVNIDVAAAYHMQLGATMSVSLSFSKK